MNHKSIFDRIVCLEINNCAIRVYKYISKGKRNQSVLSESDQLNMALIQRYTTELSTHAGTSHRIHDEKQSVEHVLNTVATIKRQDEDEKRYLHSLNDRLEELVRSLDDLEISNKKLRDDLNSINPSWGIGGENRATIFKKNLMM